MLIFYLLMIIWNAYMHLKAMNKYDHYGKQQKVIEFINFYNTKRYHQSIGDIPLRYRNNKLLK